MDPAVPAIGRAIVVEPHAAAEERRGGPADAGAPAEERRRPMNAGTPAAPASA
jgi:hypothetical protein